MRINRVISIVINSLYLTKVGLLFLDALTLFDIKSQLLKSFIYVGLLVATPATLIWNAVVLRPIRKKLLGLSVPLLVLILIVRTGPLRFVFASGAWQTQTVLYQNRHLRFKRIEFQMQNVGALGFNRRTVEVLYLTPLFMIAKPIPQGIDNHPEWIKVDREVN